MEERASLVQRVTLVTMAPKVYKVVLVSTARLDLVVHQAHKAKRVTLAALANQVAQAFR